MLLWGLVACVGSVSVGLSTGLKHFLLFGTRENWSERRSSHQCMLRSPQFSCLERAEKPTETLASQARGLDSVPVSPLLSFPVALAGPSKYLFTSDYPSLAAVNFFENVL